jgi:hypothetical protein
VAHSFEKKENSMAMTIHFGEMAGHHFHGEADLQVAQHCRRGNEYGYYHVRTRLVDRDAFECDPQMGWEVDRWFQWFGKREQ